MREPGQPSLDQLRVFVAVIDAGGFAHAARQLHRTQSVISYTIANLEEQLNIELLDRSKRKPVLTEAGKALLADARAVSLKVDGMRARAKAMSSGLEAEVSVVVDVMFPLASWCACSRRSGTVPHRRPAPAHRSDGRRGAAGDGWQLPLASVAG